MPEEAHHPELAATEAALASLAPLPGQLDRDQLMIRAGQASATRRHWLWPAATSAIALLSTGLGLALVLQPAPQQITHVVYIPVEAPSSSTLPTAYLESPSSDATGSQPADRPPPLSSYQLEQLALRFGVEALPETQSGEAREPLTPVPILDRRDSNRLLQMDNP